jgi:hypothetical protein
MMRLGRVTVQTTESETGGDGSAWVGMLIKRQSGEQRQSSDGMDLVSKRKTWTVWFWLAMRQASGSILHFVDHLDRAHPARDLTAFGHATEIIRMLPSASVKSTFSFFDHNTQTTHHGKSNQSKGSS